MLDVKVHRDFFNMETELIFGLTKRQLISIAIAIGALGIMHFFTNDFTTMTFVAVFIGFVGFMKYDIIVLSFLKLLFEPRKYIFKKDIEEVEVKLEKQVLEQKINNYIQQKERGAK